jgi:phosphorylase superfamily protein
LPFNSGERTSHQTPELNAVIAAVGLAIEARIVGRAATIATGERAALLLRRAVRRGACGIISFGVCGGLDPRLAPGTVVIASSVLSDKQEAHPTDTWWAQELVRIFPRACHSPIVGVASPMKSLEERLGFHALTGAVAVDMESQVVARVAAEFKIPFAVCRVILNPAHRKLPNAALIEIGPKGKLRLRKIAASIGKNPLQIGSLTRLGIDAGLALLALRDAKRRLGTHLGFPHEPSRQLAVAVEALETSSQLLIRTNRSSHVKKTG